MRSAALLLALTCCATAAATDGASKVLYNMTVRNLATMDADVRGCQCGRGTAMCSDAAVVLSNATGTASSLVWNQFTYPSGR